MVYNPAMPLPNDLPSSNQPDILSDFTLINQYFNLDHVPFAGIVSNVTNANPAVVTSNEHTMLTGNTVTFESVEGMTELNGNTYTITKIDENNFSLDGTDSTAFNPYTGKGFYNSANLKSGYHKHITFSNIINNPGKIIPSSALYTDNIFDIPELLYEYSTAFSFLLTGYEFVNTVQGIGFKTPWGLTINMGYVTVEEPAAFTQVDFPIPYTVTADPTTPTFCISLGVIYSVPNSLVLPAAINVTLNSFEFHVTIVNGFKSPVVGYYIAIGK